MSAGETPSRALGDVLVSIVIPCYNQAHYLRLALQSACALTHSRTEIIAVDDGSTDNTAEVVRSFSKVIYIHQSNQDVAAARNTGLRAGSGQFVIFLDQDDVLLPNAIEDGLRCFAEYPDSGFVFGRYRKIDANGKVISDPTHPPDERDFYVALLQRNPIGNPAVVMHRRDVLTRMDGFDAAFGASCDYHLYLRIARSFPVHKHGGIVSEYRWHEGNVSKDYRYMRESTLRTLHTQLEHASQTPLHAEAIKKGFAGWRTHYGQLMLKDFYTHWKTYGLNRGSLDRFQILAQYYPEGIAVLTKGVLCGIMERARLRRASES